MEELDQPVQSPPPPIAPAPDVSRQAEAKKTKAWIWAIVIVTLLCYALTVFFLGNFFKKHGTSFFSLLRSPNTANQKNAQQDIPKIATPITLREQLIQQESTFQKEIGNINLPHILGKNDTGNVCGPDQCHRDLEIVYGVENLLEKILQVEKEFAAKGWRHYGANKSSVLDDFVQQFELGNHSFGYAVFIKKDFVARIDFGKPNMTGHCFGTIICEYANKKHYPYVVSIRYAIEVRNPPAYNSELIDAFKKVGSYTDDEIRSILKDSSWSEENINKAISEINTKNPAPTPTASIKYSLDKNLEFGEYTYTNKSSLYKMAFPLNWHYTLPKYGDDKHDIRITNARNGVLEKVASGSLNQQDMDSNEFLIYFYIDPLSQFTDIKNTCGYI